ARNRCRLIFAGARLRYVRTRAALAGMALGLVVALVGRFALGLRIAALASVGLVGLVGLCALVARVRCRCVGLVALVALWPVLGRLRGLRLCRLVRRLLLLC